MQRFIGSERQVRQSSKDHGLNRNEVIPEPVADDAGYREQKKGQRHADSANAGKAVIMRERTHPLSAHKKLEIESG